VGEGAAATLVASEDGINQLGINKARAVRVLSSALKSEVVYEDAANFDAALTQETTAQALQDASLAATDLDIIELHDAFSVEEIFYLEALGIAPDGEAPAMLRDCWQWAIPLARRASARSPRSPASCAAKPARGNTPTRAPALRTW
jgi:acetyl-CoA acetyltransferase